MPRLSHPSEGFLISRIVEPFWQYVASKRAHRGLVFNFAWYQNSSIPVIPFTLAPSHMHPYKDYRWMRIKEFANFDIHGVIDGMADICYQFAESKRCRFGNRCKYVHVFTNVDSHPPSSSGLEVAFHELSMDNQKQNGKKDRNKNKKGRKPRKIHHWADHLSTFFGQYPAFDHNRYSSSSQEFYRTWGFFDWDRDDPEREEAYDGFKTALVQQFNSLYRTEVNDIES